MCRCVVSCVWACVCLTQRWLTNHLEARCRLENYFLSSLLPSLQLLLVPLVNPWTLTSVLRYECVSLGLCVCLPGWVNSKVTTFLRGHERSLRDLWSSSALTDPVPTQTASIALHPSPSRSVPPLSDPSIENKLTFVARESSSLKKSQKWTLMKGQLLPGSVIIFEAFFGLIWQHRRRVTGNVGEMT